MSTPRQYCLTLNLRDDDALIREYEAYHRPGNVWPEVIDSIQAAGILDMQIYRSGLQLIMVMTVSDAFSFEDKALQDSLNPKVAEWEPVDGEVSTQGRRCGKQVAESREYFSIIKT